jgi:hypothetical protein
MYYISPRLEYKGRLDYDQDQLGSTNRTDLQPITTYHFIDTLTTGHNFPMFGT